MIIFLNPLFFLLLFLIPIFVYFYIKKRKKQNIYSSFSDLKKIFKTNSKINFLRNFLIILIFFLFVCIFANPNYEKKSFWEKDIVFVLDISYSMLAEDLGEKRIELAKKIIFDLLQTNQKNKIWLVIFSWKSFIWLPLSSDFWMIKDYLSSLNLEKIQNNNFSWTAIWDAILSWKNILEKSSKEKIIVLLTDWEANTWINPEKIYLFLENSNIKIFSIWVWWNEKTFINFDNWFLKQKVEVLPLNKDFLKDLSEKTNWKYFDILEKEKILTDSELNDFSEKLDFSDLYDFFSCLLIFALFLLILTFIPKK